MYLSLRNKVNLNNCLYYQCKPCLLIRNKNCANCIQIERVEHIMYLGVVLDEKCNWKEHISNLKTYLNMGLRNFYYLQYLSPTSVLKHICYSIINSKLQDRISCWGGTFLSFLRPVIVSQNKIIRMICKVDKRTSSLTLYVSLKLFHSGTFIFIVV